MDVLDRWPALVSRLLAVAVSGWPWAMSVTVQWRADVVPRLGPQYADIGAHVLRGRVACLHAYEDSQAVAEACARMAAQGIEEAGDAPITS